MPFYRRLAMAPFRLAPFLFVAVLTIVLFPTEWPIHSYGLALRDGYSVDTALLHVDSRTSDVGSSTVN